MGRRNVAIACQGGGSHAAFAAGVLKRALPELGDDLVGLSGTSGGAISALAGWYGLLSDDEDPEALLDAVWDDVVARSPADRVTNEWILKATEAIHSGFPIPNVSPYDSPAASWGQRRLRRILERHVDFDAIDALVGPQTPQLVVGTVNVNAGTFETFANEDIDVDVLLASTALPSLFPAVEMNGHWHWDGLFSQNPPIRELMGVAAERKPDELWVVQSNPQTREGEPTTLPDITDRRNELAGNLSLNQELRFVETVNDWIDAGYLPTDEYTKTDIHRLELRRDLDYSSKLDRSPGFVEEMRDLGERRVGELLAER